jgi:drug/metabolite transporter (DMT)-like permease
MAVMSGTASLVLLPIGASSGDLGALDGGGWLRVALLALLSGSAAHGLLVWSQHQVPVSQISVLQLAQPVLAATWAWIFLGESVGGVQGVGMAVVVASLALFTRAAASSVPRTTDGELGGTPG